MARLDEQDDVRWTSPAWTSGVTRALTLASVLLAAPILAFDYIPFLDLPQQVGAVAVLAGGDPSWRLHDYYDIELLGSPYLLPYLVAAGLAKAVGAVVAVKLLFAMTAAAWPWALAYTAKSFGRDPRVGLFIAPIAYGTFAFMGFLNFVVAVVLWLAWLGWWRKAVTARDWTWRPWAFGGVLSVRLLRSCHGAGFRRRVRGGCGSPRRGRCRRFEKEACSGAPLRPWRRALCGVGGAFSSGGRGRYRADARH